MTDPGTHIEKVEGNAQIVQAQEIHGDIVAGNKIVKQKTVKQKITNFIFGDTGQFAQRNRRIMLERVRQFWVEGVLEKSLHKEILIQLGKQEQPDAVSHPWDMQLQEAADHEPTPIPKNKPVIEIFEDTGRSMLILGAPGSGKTITLLELARDAIARAEANPSLPIPIVFNLSSWAERKPKLDDWLIAELNLKYQIPKKVAQEWLEHEELLLLLDGLDEVKHESREACVKAINAFRQEHGLTEIVVCSRIEEYQQLVTQLNLQGAIRIHPLTLEQIDLYLANFGDELVALRTVIQDDLTLQELIVSPLMLSVMVVAYRGAAVEAVDILATVEARRKKVFDRYVACMLGQQYADRLLKWRQTEQPHTAQHTHQWLSWLACKMTQLGQTTFFMEELSPRWLIAPSSSQSQGMLSGVSYGLFSKMLVFLPLMPLVSVLNNTMSFGDPFWLFLLLGGTFIITSILAARFSDFLTLMMASGLTLSVFFVGGQVSLIRYNPDLLFIIFLIALTGVSVADSGQIKNFEKLSWSWRKAKVGVMFGIAIGIGIGFFMIWITPIREVYRLELMQAIYATKERAELITLIKIGIFFWSVVFCGLIFLVVSGLTRGNIIESSIRQFPNQGIWKSLRNAGTIGILLVIVFGGGALVGIFVSGLSVEYGLCFSFLPVLSAILFFGGSAWIQHFVLRFILFVNRFLPWNLTRFLDYAADRILLRKVGGGYIFIHRLLLEYFAALGDGERQEER